MTAAFVDQAMVQTRQSDWNALRQSIRQWQDGDTIAGHWANARRWVPVWNRDWNALQNAIGARLDNQKIEEAWDKCERWI